MNEKEIYKKVAHFSIAESGENSTAIDRSRKRSRTELTNEKFLYLLSRSGVLYKQGRPR